MMIELKSENFGTVESFFEQKKQYIPALSVIHGNYPGRVFVDNEQAPHVAIVWVISRWLYIEGGATTEDSKEAVYRFIKKVLLPDCELRNVNWFEIYSSDSKQWDDLFIDGIEHEKVHKHYESLYTLNIDQFKRAKAKLK